MNVLTFSEARACLKTVMDKVCEDHDPTVITRVNGEHVVLMSMADYSSMQETLHLLSTEANANRLRQSIANMRAGKVRVRGLIGDESKESQSQE